MSKSLIAVLALLCAGCLSGFAQEIKHSIYLIGDAGKDTIPGPALRLLEDELLENKLSSVLFLGDNIYPAGLEGKEGNKKKRLSELKLLSQLERTEQHQGHVFWVPGNHDWKAGRWTGHWLVQKEADFVENYYAKNTSIKNDSGHVFMPKTGLPGPTIERIEEHGFSVIAIDIQWWLQDQFFHKVPTEDGLNKKKMEDRFLLRLDSLLNQCKTENVQPIIAAHHPIFSNGHHGAAKQPFRFVFNWV
ncbi:MAG: metallophosphoesterase, partial [Flavobacteriales bacterium]